VTTGSRIYDLRFDNGIGVTAGRYFKRVWNGGNSVMPTKRWNTYTASIQDSYSATVQWKQKTATQWKSGDIIGLFGDPVTSTPLGGWTANDETRLLARVVEQVRNHDFNAAVFLAESKEALTMIRDTATRIATAGLNVRRGDLFSAARALGVAWKGKNRKKALSANWLELQYGWLPLMKDCRSASEALLALTDRPMVQTYRARGYVRFKGYWTQPNSALYMVNNYYQRVYIVKMQEAYSKVASLGLLDPEVVAWELVPFSFVADWFLPIGNYLETRAHVGRIQGSWLRSDKVHRECRWSANKSLAIDVLGGESTYSRSITMNRSTIAAPVVPFPNLKPFSKVASWQHTANALALVRQVFK
jgi:hypothetical protein